MRLAIAIGQGIALALDRPVVPVSTLAALALGAADESPLAHEGTLGAGEDEQRVLAAIDARMGEVYVGAFELRAGEAMPLTPEQVAAPESVQLPDALAGWIGRGTGFAAAQGALATRLAPTLARIDAQALPHAAQVARLAVTGFARGEAVAPERIEPVYLRNNVALTLAEQQALRDSR